MKSFPLLFRGGGAGSFKMETRVFRAYLFAFTLYNIFLLLKNNACINKNIFCFPLFVL